MACGAGAGIAAFYNVPFGGAMFALEVLLGTLWLTLVPPALIAATIATAVSSLFLPNEPTYTVPAYAATWIRPYGQCWQARWLAWLQLGMCG